MSYASRLLEEGLVDNVEVEIIDLNDFEMSIFSADRESHSGIPPQAHEFFNKIGAADAVLVSFAEHNGSYTAAYKNLFDWASRIDARVYQEKPAVLLATSPGGRGGGSILAIAAKAGQCFGEVDSSA